MGYWNKYLIKVKLHSRAFACDNIPNFDPTLLLQFCLRISKMYVWFLYLQRQESYEVFNCQKLDFFIENWKFLNFSEIDRWIFLKFCEIIPDLVSCQLQHTECIELVVALLSSFWATVGIYFGKISSLKNVGHPKSIEFWGVFSHFFSPLLCVISLFKIWLKGSWIVRQLFTVYCIGFVLLSVCLNAAFWSQKCCLLFLLYQTLNCYTSKPKVALRLALKMHYKKF